MERALLEREREVARLGELVRGAAAGRGGLLVIEGVAGIGKTRLLAHAQRLAEEAGLASLSASGDELEHEFGFGVVRQLLEARAASGSAELLEGAAALAAPALGLAAPGVGSAAAGAAAPAHGLPGMAAGDRYAVLHGLYWLVANLAAERPLLIAVDDAQWADEPSLRFLAYLARRVGELPVAVIVACRPALPGEDRRVLEAIVAEGAVLEPAPLTEAGVGALAEQRLGTVSDPALIAACLRVTGGNALLVEELLSELSESGVSPNATAAEGLERIGAERIGRRVSRRIAQLDPAAGPLAEAVAALGDGCELATAAALAGLEPAAARAAAAGLAAADLFSDAGSLRFRHPLIRAAVAERVPAVELGRTHARAARLLAEGGAPPAALAAHLLAAPAAGDPWVAETLAAAAREARGQGEPELAAAYLRRALAEPPPDPQRGSVLLALGHAEHAAGAPGAADRLREAWAASGDPRVALEVAAALAEQARWLESATIIRETLGEPAGGAPAAPGGDGERPGGDGHGARAEPGGDGDRRGGAADGARSKPGGDGERRGGVGHGASGAPGSDGERAGAADREVELHLRALLADTVRMDPSIAGDEPERLQALASTLTGATPGERHVLAAAAVVTPVDTAAEHAHAAKLAQRSAADGHPQARRAETGIASNFIRAGRLEQAELVVEQALAAARRGGFIQRHAVMLSLRGWIGIERGALAEARDDLEVMLALAPDVALPLPVIGSGAVMLALVVAEFGELERAGDLLEAHGMAGELPEEQVMNPFLAFRARIRLAQGRPDEALADALEVGARYERLGIHRAVPPWRSLAAVLLAATGDSEQALALVNQEQARAERWGTALARGLALRGLGLVTGDTEALARAVTELAASPNRLELARARVDLGAALRRAGRRAEAREPLGLGMDGAHACGARPLAERARTELLATGARPRRLALAGTDALTPSERRVAALAADGLTNRRIAQELFVTTATVETHLRHAFRKLDVRARGELARALDRSG